MAKTSMLAGAELDCPREGEVISVSRYTFRITANHDASLVEICLDNGAWQPCRESVGYWWYDWAGYPEGEHAVAFRVRTRDGLLDEAAPRKFHVELKAMTGGKPW